MSLTAILPPSHPLLTHRYLLALLGGGQTVAATQALDLRKLPLHSTLDTRRGPGLGLGLGGAQLHLTLETTQYFSQERNESPQLWQAGDGG